MKPEFSNWLKLNKAFTDASASDVCSRLRRVISICPMDLESELESNIFALGQKKEFKGLSASVKSQLKRSLKLYKEFQSSRSKK
jgi:DNA (cytosine-5)-methyltransferase 1